MAELTPSSRPDLDEEVEPSVRSTGARRPLRLIDPAVRASLPSHPPSDPRPLASRPGADASGDKPLRVQLIAALLLLLVLVVVPLYLWRRPRAAATEETTSASASAALVPAPIETSAPPDPAKLHTKDGVTVSDAKVVGCHDRGSKHTAPGACDRVPGLESAIGKAILDASSCVPAGTPAGAIAFVIDASYSRHKSPIHVAHQKTGTTMPPHVVAACVAEVKRVLGTAALDSTHAHGKYDIEIDATYVARTRP
jgi:hypothetical protein